MNWDGFRWDVLRPGQRQAIQKIEECLIEQKKHISIVLPCRYGKSHVMRLSAIRGYYEQRVACSLAFAPWQLIRDGLVDDDEWQAAAGISQISQPVRYKALKKTPKTLHWTPNGEMFLASTTSLLVQAKEAFVDFVDHQVHQTGLPVMIHWDECHIGTPDVLKWGQAMQELVAAGAVVVLYTATEHRSDGLIIPGWNYTKVPIEEGKRNKRRHDHASGLTMRELWGGMEFMIELEADHKTSFAEAWQETPSPLCHFNDVPFDVDMTQVDGGDWEPGVLLSSLPNTTARQVLRLIVTSKRSIKRGCELLVEALRVRREREPSVAAVVFCVNDQDDGGDEALNRHAKAIKKMLALIAPDLEVLIATSADEDEKGADLIKAFEKGRGDVIIVKNQGGAGWNCPRLKVALDLSTVRSASDCVQRWNRIATPYRGILTCDLIRPADMPGSAVFDRFIKDEGGSRIFEVGEKIDEWVELPGEQNERSLFFVDGTDGHSFHDSMDNWAEKDEYPKVMAIVRRLPGIEALFTLAQVAEQLRDVKVTVDTESGFRSLVSNPDTEAELLRDDINRLARSITDARVSRKANPEMWRNEIKLVFADAKRAGGADAGLELGDIMDLAILGRIKKSLIGMMDQLL